MRDNKKEIFMKEDVFGSIMYDGKMVNIDKEDVEKLKTISDELKKKASILNQKAESIFKQ